MIKRFFLIYVVSMCWFSCERVFIENDPPDNYASNFDLFWNDFDQHYPSFKLKKIDWNRIYHDGMEQINTIENDRDFFDLMSQVVLNFKDSHVALIGKYGRVNFIKSNGITENTSTHIHNYVKDLNELNPVLNYGNIEGTELIYIQIETFSGNLSTEYFAGFDKILAQLENKAALIIDIRSNGGGLLTNATTIASQLIDNSSCYARLIYRKDTHHNNFTNGLDTYISPQKSLNFNLPIALLTNRGTTSAAELFTLALREYSHVTIVGDTTNGALGFPIWRELPNGWTYRFPVNLVENCKGDLFEDIGIPPDIPVWITSKDSINGIDTILEKAIEILENDINNTQ